MLAIGLTALAFTSPQRRIVRRASLPAPPLIVAAPPPSPPPPVKGSGYYVRPSAALERGGGFYVPGAPRVGLMRTPCPCISLTLSATRAQGSKEIVFVSSWR